MIASYRSLFFVFTVVSLCLGCSSKTEPKPKEERPKEETKTKVEKRTHPSIDYEEGPMPSDETVVGEFGSHKVTVADFEYVSRLGLLFAPKPTFELTDEQLAMPHVHSTMTQSLLLDLVIEAEAKKRSIVVTDEEIKSFLANHKQLGKFGSAYGMAELDKMLAPYKLKSDDLKTLATKMLLKKKVSEAVVNDTPKEEVWTAYKHEKDVIEALVVMIPNTPSGAEIDDFVAMKKPEIETHFDKNKRRYRIPKRVKLDMVKFAKGADTQQLQKAANALKKGERPQEIATQMGLTSQSAFVVRSENAAAFNATTGTSGYEIDGPRGTYAWLVTGSKPSEDATLTSGIRREIAAELLRTGGPIKSIQTKLEKWVDKRKKWSTKKLASAAIPSPGGTKVSKFINNGFIDGFGLAEEVGKDAFARNPDDRAFSDILMSRQRLFAYRVFDREVPSRKAFEENYSLFREKYLAAKLPTMAHRLMAPKDGVEPKIDVTPLRVKFGVVRKQARNAARREALTAPAKAQQPDQK